jgi:hypothetical protein
MVLIRLFLNEIILIILIKVKLKIMEKKLFAIECENVALVVRPNGDTVIVTETGELVLNNTVMEQIVRNSGAYKSFVATKNDVFAGLERDNTKLQNEIVGLKEELESVKGANDNDDIHRLKRERIKLRNNIMRLEKELEEAKADKDSLQQKLVNATIGAQPIAKGYIVNIGNLAQGTLGYLFDIDGNFIADCGTDKRAKRVQYLLQEGKVSLDVVMEIFGNAGLKKSRVADIPASGEK